MPLSPGQFVCDLSGVRRGSRRARSGLVVTLVLMFVLPLLIAVGLALLQLSLVKTAQQRTRAAAEHAAECACAAFLAGGGVDPNGFTAVTNAAYEGAGLMLGYLGGDFCVEVELLDREDNDGIADHVAVAVTIPMHAVSTNYLGLLCGATTDNVRLRSVVIHRCVQLEGCLDRLLRLIDCIENTIVPGTLQNNLLNSLQDVLDRLERGLPLNASVCNDFSANFPQAVRQITAADLVNPLHDPCCVQLSFLTQAMTLCSCVGCPERFCDRIDEDIQALPCVNTPCVDPCAP